MRGCPSLRSQDAVVTAHAPSAEDHLGVDVAVLLLSEPAGEVVVGARSAGLPQRRAHPAPHEPPVFNVAHVRPSPRHVPAIEECRSRNRSSNLRHFQKYKIISQRLID